MGQYHDDRFPGESEAYRKARDRLLAAEINLRKQIAEVASQRRDLPLGGKLKEDYVFNEGDLANGGAVRQTRFSELFAPGKDSLIVYSFMYAPAADSPCPMCTALLDGLNGNAPHIQQRINFAVVGRAPLQNLRDWARQRGWRNLRLLSSFDNSYNTDYVAERGDDQQIPAINVFRRTKNGMFHTYNTELLYAPSEPGMHPRHADMLWPLWNMFDLTPDGRGTDWFPSI